MNKKNTKKKKNKILSYFSENDIESNSDTLKEKMITTKKHKNNIIKIIKNIILAIILILLIIFIFIIYKQLTSLKQNSNSPQNLENLIKDKFGNLSNDLSVFKKENLDLKNINKKLEKDTRDYQEKIKNLNLELQNLKLKNDETSKKLLKYQKENTNQKENISNYKKDIEKLTKNITELAKENNELKSKNSNLNRIITRLNDEYKIYNDKIKKLKTLNEEINQKLSFQIKSNDKLKIDIIKLQNQNREFKELELLGTDFNNSIIHNFEELKLLRKWVSGDKEKLIKSLTFKLLYKATIDGDSLNTIYRLVNNSSPTIILFETKNHRRFGGYTEVVWGENIIDGYCRQRDPNAFLFSLDYQKSYLTNAYNTGIFYGLYEMDFEKIDSMNYNLKIKNNFFSTGCDESNSKEAYQPTKCELSGEEHFVPNEVEIYHVIKVLF